MIELKIDPEFENLIPKLADVEFAQLEKNILADGKVKEPIVVWNGTIIDGHHRYYIVKKHPEIPFDIEEKDFANKYAAMAWACANQLGRRNLKDNDRAYLVGKQQDSEKMASGGTGANRYTILQGSSTPTSVERGGKTATRIAEENDINVGTVYEYEKYSKGIDIADEVVPGLKEEILHGDIDVPKTLVKKIPSVTPDKQRKAAVAISEKDIKKAKEILGEKPEIDKQENLKQYGLNDDGKEIAFTIDDLFSEIETNFTKSMEVLENSIDLHRDILDDKNLGSFIEKLEGMFELKITEFMEEI